MYTNGKKRIGEPPVSGRPSSLNAMTGAGILHAVAEFGKSFHRCVGSADTVAAKAMHGPRMRWFDNR